MAGPSRSAPSEEANQQFARDLVARLALCLKVATVHQLSNAAVRPSIQSLLDLINPRLKTGEPVLVQSVNDTIFVNHEPVRLDHVTYEAAESLRAVFERLGFEELSFPEPLSEDDLRKFLASFQKHHAGSERGKILSEQFQGVAIRTLESVAPRSQAGSDAHRVIQAYAQFMAVLERTIRQIEAGKGLRLSRLRRALQLLHDASQGQSALLLAITQLRRESAGVSLHLTAVTALTLMVGRRLGLQRGPLIEAGMAAALHDIARDKVLQGRSTESIPAATTQRALDTVLELSRWADLPVMLKSAVVAYEHRLPASSANPMVLSRLVAVPCAYDLLRHPPPPRAGFGPAQALDIVLGGGGTRYDSIVTRALGSIVGRYPPGTLVTLSNGMLAAVVERPDPDDVARVKVRLLPRTQPHPSDLVIDLGSAVRNPEGLTITHVIDPRTVPVNVLDCLFFREDLEQ